MDITGRCVVKSNRSEREELINDIEDDMNEQVLIIFLNEQTRNAFINEFNFRLSNLLTSLVMITSVDFVPEYLHDSKSVYLDDYLLYETKDQTLLYQHISESSLNRFVYTTLDEDQDLLETISIAKKSSEISIDYILSITQQKYHNHILYLYYNLITDEKTCPFDLSHI